MGICFSKNTDNIKSMDLIDINFSDVEYFSLNGKTFNLKTKKGVHLASGGFDHNAEMKKNFLSVPSYGVGVKSNTGDGIKMAMKLGADLRNMNEVWGSVVYKGEMQ